MMESALNHGPNNERKPGDRQRGANLLAKSTLNGHDHTMKHRVHELVHPKGREGQKGWLPTLLCGLPKHSFVSAESKFNHGLVMVRKGGFKAQ